MAFAGKSAADAVRASQGNMINGKKNQIPTTVVDGQGRDLESQDATVDAKVDGINLAISIGTSTSESKEVPTRNATRGAVVAAGHDLKCFAASGAGRDRDITVRGSRLQAVNRLVLDAQDEIRLLAAKNTAAQHSTYSSSSGSADISIGTNGLLLAASASGTRGNANGSDATWTNTHVDAGNQATMTSGGDTTVKGAVVQTPQDCRRCGRHPRDRESTGQQPIRQQAAPRW
jgi:filamentous hemagglutinin